MLVYPFVKKTGTWVKVGDQYKKQVTIHLERAGILGNADYTEGKTTHEQMKGMW